MSEDDVDIGGPIQYEVGMSLDEKQREYWGLYTAENREKFFWLFLNSFVDKWQQKVWLVIVKRMEVYCIVRLCRSSTTTLLSLRFS